MLMEEFRPSSWRTGKWREHMAIVRSLNVGLAAAALIGLSMTPPAAAASATPLPSPETLQGERLFDGNPFGTILAVIFSAAVLYGLYDVLLDGDDDEDDEPVSP
jgi:hypothetical protein